MNKPSIPKGTRDFIPEVYLKRRFIFNTIEKKFKTFGFQPIETPAIENIQTLTGKYGEEGDQLLFKILRSGDFLQKVNDADLDSKNSKNILSAICDKGLRYDLTVPLARFVVMNRNELQFPFKRYQIQPVWRADRPQRGRYREFYQCDADIIGTQSMVSDTEMLFLFDEVFHELNIPEVKIHLNNRKILAGICEKFNFSNRFSEFTVAIDKLDKAGKEGVLKELSEKGFATDQCQLILEHLTEEADNLKMLENIKNLTEGISIAKEGIAEIESILDLCSAVKFKTAQLKLDFSLARGLDYYTGSIFEVKTAKVNIGSIASGGRYDNLTETFGVKDMQGIGISFGADRIYDVMKELNLFPESAYEPVKVLAVNFGGASEKEAFKIVNLIRSNGIAADLYPEAVKLKKQFAYADKLNIPFVLIIGEEELQKNEFTLKNMKQATQSSLNSAKLIEMLLNEKLK